MESTGTARFKPGLLFISQFFLLVMAPLQARADTGSLTPVQSLLPDKLLASPLTEHYQQTRLSIQQQRLDNELAQLQRDYAQLQLQRRQHQRALNQQLPATTEEQADSSGQASRAGRLVSEVRYPQLHLALYQQAQSWRWQRREQLLADDN